ncbi:hypothetical protein C490_10620 [Natronobacterium gregoryi SP2]|uniref:Uncharacterized protein n=1 Tax=Natronobacterium gregoryi (strain ATCC 43098 / DSM 3393 / CCM 3738 / CIP 104747 / IAM 13177 / JCM 8860 / NBRC 102187 / NCIMB 2189 / SP2) TaxID=797304 RepID=L9Y2E0_NATGS|nr:hypothetical protein C490_10620 [Natronobacterium gregoryi SP2]
MLGIALGAVLVAVGVGSYVLSDFASVTALIPAIFGVVIVGFGLVAVKTPREKLAVLSIGVLSLLGVLGSLRGVPDVIALLTGGPVDSTVAAVAQGSMILIGIVLFVAAGRDILG